MGNLKAAFLAGRANEELVEGPAGAVLVRGLTVRGKDEFEQLVLNGKPWRSTLALHCLLEPDSKAAVFDNAAELDEVPAHMLEPYINAAIRLSAVNPSEMESIEGNSERTPSSGIASD